MNLDSNILKREYFQSIIFGINDCVLWTIMPLSVHYLIIIDKNNLLSKCGGSEDNKRKILERIIASGNISNGDFEPYDSTKITYLNDASKKDILTALSSDYITNTEKDSLPQWFMNEVMLWKLQE